MQLQWDYRVAHLLELVEKFNAESQYSITYSKLGSINYLYKLISDNNTSVIVHYEEDKLAGCIIVHADKEFSNEYFGYMNKMYVLPEYRGTRTGRALLAEACKWFDERNCIMSFATATAAIGQDKLFINLLGKFGFVPQGMVLIRKGKQHE